MTAVIFVPTIASFLDDLKARHDLLEPARKQGLQTGLMLVIRPQDLTTEKIGLQLGNLARFVNLDTADRPAVIAMHPNMPIDGNERLNFLTNVTHSLECVKKGIEFVARIPRELAPAEGKVLSFHLNTLVKPNKWVPNQDHWSKRFEKVVQQIAVLANFGKSKGVDIAVETTPIPEFGDLRRDEKHLLEDGTYWSDLGNPWPLLFWRDEISKLRKAGCKLAIDLCHSYIAYKAVLEVKRLVESGKSQAFSTYMVHPSDIEAAQSADFAKMVLQNTMPGDIWHVNDARGMYQTALLQGKDRTFEEGVVPFEGDIPGKPLKELIAKGRELPIKLVIEVNETDFQNSPNTKATLAIVLNG